jgi:hypothetical protein
MLLLLVPPTRHGDGEGQIDSLGLAFTSSWPSKRLDGLSKDGRAMVVSYPEPQIGSLLALATTITCASGYEVVDRQRNVNIRKGSAVEQVLLEELEILKLRESSRSLCRQDKVFARRPLC